LKMKLKLKIKMNTSHWMILFVFLILIVLYNVSTLGSEHGLPEFFGLVLSSQNKNRMWMSFVLRHEHSRRYDKGTTDSKDATVRIESLYCRGIIREWCRGGAC
jgi:hypothetical protein